jgi:hypothetical protein
MRYFRRLPPLLRVASILGLLFPLASIALLLSVLVMSLLSYTQEPLDFGRLLIASNLGMLGGACSFAVTTYSARFRRPDWGPVPLGSLQSQVRAIVLLAALPTCALALALFIPPTPPASFLVSLLDIAITLIAAFALLAAYLWATVYARAVG